MAAGLVIASANASDLQKEVDSEKPLAIEWATVLANELDL
jgi:hypothetical protein